MQDLLQGKEERSCAGQLQCPPSLPPEGAPGLAQPRPGPALQALVHAPLQPPGVCSQRPPHPLLGPALQGHPLTFTARAHGADLGEVPQMLLPGFLLLFRAALPSWPLCVSFHPVSEPHASWHCLGVSTRQAGVE